MNIIKEDSGIILITTNRKFRLIVVGGYLRLCMDKNGDLSFKEEGLLINTISFNVFSKESMDIITMVLDKNGISYNVCIYDGELKEIPWFYPHNFSRDYIRFCREYQIVIHNCPRLDILERLFEIFRDNFDLRTYWYYEEKEVTPRDRILSDKTTQMVIL